MESGHKCVLNDILRKKRKSKTRKPECPVFLTYGPAQGSPFGWIKRWKEDIICICQRLRYGYCYRDVWSIDWWFVTVVPNMIHDLRINGHGYPGHFTGTEEENVRKWNGILKRMEFLFRVANEETCRRKNSYQDAHDEAMAAFTLSLNGPLHISGGQFPIKKRKESHIYVFSLLATKLGKNPVYHILNLYADNNFNNAGHDCVNSFV